MLVCRTSGTTSAVTVNQVGYGAANMRSASANLKKSRAQALFRRLNGSRGTRTRHGLWLLEASARSLSMRQQLLLESSSRARPT